ncbi:MAG: hypothetical protein GF311_28650 [Candidatus Lokiarchaeota archaeon]|nr:hypothetical protein [Candidatus Lokiarchaeota archaeon]
MEQPGDAQCIALPVGGRPPVCSALLRDSWHWSTGTGLLSTGDGGR